mgnify:CR=1 FL=1|tara:strand:+ start:152805 stop:153248 length:444 start_codon:yes stop_codon:yes gene_type:complete
MKFLSALVLLGSLNVYANTIEIETSIRCDKYQFGIDNLNEKLPEDRQITLNCEGTEKSALGGLVTYGAKSVVSISTSLPLCETSEQVYSKVHTFGKGGAFVGYDMNGVHPVIELLEANGIVVDALRYGTGTGMLGHEVHGIQFPYCE